jgi:hypothetical protein
MGRPAHTTARLRRVGEDLDHFRPRVGAYCLSAESAERTCDETH